MSIIRLGRITETPVPRAATTSTKPAPRVLRPQRRCGIAFRIIKAATSYGIREPARHPFPGARRPGARRPGPRRRRRARQHPLPRILRGQHPQPTYAPGLRPCADEFLAWCSAAGVLSIGAVQPVHVATWIEAETRELAPPSVAIAARIAEDLGFGP